MTKGNTVKINVDAKLLRAAQKCHPKDDARAYLNGIHLGVSGEVEGTNGHIAFTTKGNFELDSELVISIVGAIPAFADAVELDLIDEHRGFAHCYQEAGGTKDKLLAFEVVPLDRPFPSIESIVPVTPIKAVERIGISAGYMSMPEKVFGKDASLIIEYRDMTNAIVNIPVRDNWPDGTKLVIMPMRMPEYD